MRQTDEAIVRMGALYPISVASASRHSTAGRAGAIASNYELLRLSAARDRRAARAQKRRAGTIAAR